MFTFSLADRTLSWHLGLGDIGDDSMACHGYQNGCRCPECLEREELARSPRRRRVVLPWELDAA